MAKHDQAFIEVTTRFFFPLGHDLSGLSAINLDDLFQQAEAINIHKSHHKRRKKSNAQAGQ